jgi:hypothetical protein
MKSIFFYILIAIVVVGGLIHAMSLLQKKPDVGVLPVSYGYTPVVYNTHDSAASFVKATMLVDTVVPLRPKKLPNRGRNYSTEIDSVFITDYESIRLAGNTAQITCNQCTSGGIKDALVARYQDSIIVTDKWSGRYRIFLKDTILDSPIFHARRFTIEEKSVVVHLQ